MSNGITPATSPSASGRSERDIVREVIEHLPPDATIEDAQYHLYVAKLIELRSSKVDQALALGVEEATRQGLLVSQEDVEKRFGRWRDRSIG